MKKILYIIVPVILLGIVIFKLKTNKDISQSKVYHTDKEQPVNVQVDTLRLQLIDAEQIFSGSFEPEKEVKIGAETQGKINTIYVELGSFVRKGQTLIKIDDALLKLQLQSATVQIEGLEADVNRYTILANADAIQGVQLEKAKLALKSANVQRNTLLEQIAKTTITAPFSGVVTLKFSEIGAFAAPGMPLLQITDLARLRFTVNVSESDVHLFHLNQSYSLKVDAYTDLSLSGKAILIGSQGNVANNYPVQFLINNTADMKIKSGMFGKVLISEIDTKEGLIIPSSAVVGSDIESKVYLVKNNKAILQNISIERRVEKGIVVKSGLQAGDIIVKGGFINLQENSAVSISK